MSLSGKVALVTGGSRGVGRGVARALGEAGATVYLTGRTVQQGQEAEPGTIQHAAKEVDDLGGKGIAVQCDHSVDGEVQALFERIEGEAGHLDVLVNNVYSGVHDIADHVDKLFWQVEPEYWDHINNVGLRSHYIGSVYGARMMVKRRSGLIINVSSLGGLAYLFSVPYGVGKAAMDRMAADMAVELRKDGVAVVSLWPGFVKTELTASAIKDVRPAIARILETYSETPLMTGRAVAVLAGDDKIIRKTGRVLFSAEIARRYGLTDENGKRSRSPRSLNAAARAFLPPPLAVLAYLVPPIRLPLRAVAWVLRRFSMSLKGKGYRRD